MNYIVVGTDCSGKSTLVEMLSDVTEMKVKKGSSFQDSQCTQDELFTKFLRFAEMDNVIFDRFTYCNFAYATLFNDYAMLSAGQRRVIETDMKNTKVIYLYAKDKVLEKRYLNRGDDYVNLKTLKKAKRLYEKELKNIKYLPVIKYNTGKMTTKEIVEDILLNH